MLRRIFPALLVALIYSSCSKDSIAPKYDFTVPSGCDVSSVNYSPEIKLIISKNCAYSGCHFPGENNYDFTKYEVVADRIRSGRFTERMYLPVSHPLHMPTGTTINPCEFAQLMTWINNGFPEN
jgi:hypothetical protein